MRDETFELFVSEFGEATHRIEVPESSVEKWRGKLPDQLLRYWEEEGWCGYANGLLWTVNPDHYEDLIDEWLNGSGLEEVDAFHVIARTAFGNLYACGEKTGQCVTVACASNVISALENELKQKTREDLDLSIRAFLAFSEPRDFDMHDDSGRPLFERAVAHLGQLSADKLYGFEPALVIGGSKQLNNLSKLDLDVHLTILRQFSAPDLLIAKTEI